MRKNILFFLLAFTFVFAQEQNINKPSIVILGGGISGLSSGIYLGRGGMEPILIEGQKMSQIAGSPAVENWPSEKKISGSELVGKLKEQAVAAGCQILQKEVVRVDFSKRPFSIEIKDFASGETSVLKADKCVIAMGCKPRFLNIEGEKAYWGKGVSSCALCDGTLYKDKTVAVVGGSKAAVLESAYLSNLAQKVYLIVRADSLRKNVEPEQKKALLNKKNVEILYSTAISKIEGDGSKVEKLLLSNGKEIAADAVFLAIGQIPNTELFKTAVDLDQNGFILVKDDQKTSVEGVFAAGDIVSGKEKQAILAAASGVQAALALEQEAVLKAPVLEASEGQAVVQHAEKTNVLESKKEELKEEPAVLEAKQNIPVLAETEVKKEVLPVQQDLKSEALKETVIAKEIVSKQELEEEIKNSTVPVLVDFYAVWCGPCQKIAPVLEGLSKEKVKLLKVNVDNCPDLVREYKIMAMPTVILFGNEGQVLSTKIGFYEITSLIQEFSFDALGKGSVR